MATTIQYLLRLITNEMKLKADQLLEPYHVTLEQAQTMRFIFESETGSVTQNDLIQIFNRKGSTVSSALSSLEKQQLISRHSDQNDTRKKVVTLTPIAKKDIREIIACLEELESTLFADIPKVDQAALKEILFKMNSNLQRLDDTFDD